MSDQTDYDEQPEPDDREDLRELREAAKSGKAAKADAEALRRELAFSKAGIDTDSVKGKMFVRAYDGDLETGAIKAQFEDLFGGGDGEIPAPDEPDPAAEEELRKQTQDRRDVTAAGTDHTPPPPPDLITAGYERMQDEMNKGRPMEFAFREALSGTIAAANNGDERAIWTGWTPEELEGWG